MNSENIEDKAYSEADRKAAHQFLTELRTRIATQSLPYQHGVEERALTSLFEIFGHARAAIKDNPGCEKFADLTIRMLNRDLRPMTAKWHHHCSNGMLSSRDGGDAFREDLAELQVKLRAQVCALREIAYGYSTIDEDVPGPFDCEEFDHIFGEPIAYGIAEGDQIEVMRNALAESGIEASGVADINKNERDTVEARRKLVAEAASTAGMGYGYCLFAGNNSTQVAVTAAAMAQQQAAAGA